MNRSFDRTCPARHFIGWHSEISNTGCKDCRIFTHRLRQEKRQSRHYDGRCCISDIFRSASRRNSCEIWKQRQDDKRLYRFSRDDLQEYFDTLTLAAAQTGLGSSDRSAFAGASMAWADVIDISKRMDVNKVPKSGRVIAIDANLAAEFFGIDVVKNAISYNQNYLSTGTFIQFMGMSFFITGLLSTITVSAAQKYTMVGIYGPGVAAIVSIRWSLKKTSNQ